MRFFTPDLYLRFNSPDDDEADRADADWEAALRAYRAHLDRIRDAMPPSVQKLAGLNFHDAELLARHEEAEPFSPPVAVLALEHGGQVTNLIYALWDRVRESPVPKTWPFSKERTHWLYDEIDAVRGYRGLFLHRILFSDGRVLEIPFLSVVATSFALREPNSDAATRQTA